MAGKKWEKEVIYRVIVYSHSITPRLQYITDFLSAYYNHPVVITTSVEEYQAAEGIKLNYTSQPLSGDDIWIEPSGLLFDKGIRSQGTYCFTHSAGYKAFYKAHGHIGFDLFSAIFFLITRYEEYLPHKRDAYGRYDHQNALAYREDFLHLPLINTWLEDFGKTIGLTSPNTPPHLFTFVPTYDIDIAWSYRNKEPIRNAGGAVRSLLKGQWGAVKERMQVLQHKAQDPYDSYAWMDSMHQQYGLKPLYFIHVGQKGNRYDKNISTDNKEFRELVRSLASKYLVGIHPSWQSGDEPHWLLKEKKILEELAQQPVTISRQHYIRFSFPQTFRYLIAAGIKHDFSMGYGSINGFRASIATPFYWYDLKQEVQTDLMLHPFPFMDANSFFEQKQTPEQSLKEMLQYYRTVKEVNGTLITVWHNTFLGTDKMFEGWRQAYESFLQVVQRGSI